MSKRPPTLLIIIFYKALTATILALSALSIFLTLRNYGAFQNFTETLVLGGKRGIVYFLMEKASGLSPKTLVFSGIVLSVYSLVSAVEAVGLWLDKDWAKWLVIGVVGISIPPEIYELIRGVSLLKLIIFILNLGILAYLVTDFLKSRGSKKESVT